MSIALHREFPRLDIALQTVCAESQHALDLADKGEFARVVVNPVLIAVENFTNLRGIEQLVVSGVAFSAA